MILSRLKPALASNPSEKSTNRSTVTPKNLLNFKEYLIKRDYVGAITYLEMKKDMDKIGDIEMWIAYCYFHLGNYKKALNIYEDLLKANPKVENLLVNIACCYFYLGMYSKSKKTLDEVPLNSLKTRLNFHLSHKLNDENALMEYHEQLEDVVEDQLSLASIHYMRAHYQEAINIYKKLLQRNRSNWALNVYMALCYYKLDYYDASQEALTIYLNQHSDSLIATNLKACNHFRLYSLNDAETEIRSLTEISSHDSFGHDLVQHNLVVFRNGEDALQIFPSLVDIVPEARLNLAIYYLKQNNSKEAYELIKNLEPAVPQEYILKGVVNAVLGQELNSIEHIKTSEEYFHMIGNSESEKDTIPGRQCMASAHFLSGQFDEVLLYLTSIKSYFHSDDVFNFNYAQAKCSKKQYREAEEILLLIKDLNIKNDQVYNFHLARCYIMNKKPRLAWELYLKMESSPESFNLLLLIANDCYRMGEFWYATKAFDMLDRLEPVPEFWEGKRGAIVGVFQGVIAQKFSVDLLGDVLQLLRNSVSSQAEHIAKVIRKWAKDKRLTII
ncbi:intraflagellar transport protein 56 [Agrilus planipennis]|uniref:Intraflagellar transport protein 56 n=1 Tax=Agrilus planipennis TaxID=224129 RepID=A0A1W4WFA0_AGRPL|nr:intraflagellar transport protein 56 [Agrilus planipennis]